MSEFKCSICGGTDYYESNEKDRGVRRRCKSCHSERMQKVYATEAYKAKHRADDRRRRRNCAPADYNEKLTEQNGKCAICGKELGDKLLADHDHKTGKFRALLCRNCNIGLGYFQDSPELLESAAEYLKKFLEVD